MGHDIAGIGPVELARRGMSRAFQLVNIFPALTVRETLAVAVASRLRRVANPFRSLRRDDVLQADAERVADVLGLRARLETVASTLSQGEKKLLDIASAFALNPERDPAGRADQRRFDRRQARDHGGAGRRRRKPPACAPSSRSSTTWIWSSATRIASSRCRRARAGRHAARCVLQGSGDDLSRGGNASANA